MLRIGKLATLAVARRLGAFRLVMNTPWRQNRLLILCYHGLSMRDEHEWRNLYVTPEFFRGRLQLLARLRCNVLTIAGALARLKAGELPPRSVVITFDDGFYDFYHLAYPLLRHFGFPATVYQTTYYSDYPFPIFNLVLSYLLWTAGGRQDYGSSDPLPYSPDAPDGRASHRQIVRTFREHGRQRKLTPDQLNELAAQVAGEFEIDYSDILRLRMFQLMRPAEIAEIVSGGIDVQLHTHRHRTPADRALFSREIRDNREWLARITGSPPDHFCYPNGIQNPDCVGWLKAEGVLSAVTCAAGLATRMSEPLLLPRLVDSMQVTDLELEAWLTGAAAIFPRRHYRLSLRNAG